MKIRLVPSGWRRRSYRRVEASPASGWRIASPKPWAFRKSALRASRSELNRPSFPVAVRGQARPARVVPRFRFWPDLYIESMRRKASFQALGPLDHRRAVLQRLVQADLVGLVGRGEAVEVEVGDVQAGAFVELDQGEGRARHVLGRRGQ